jgi:hypothetical protein
MVLSHMGLYMAAATSEFKPHPNGYTRRFPAATRIVTCAPIQELFYLSSASHPVSGGLALPW